MAITNPLWAYPIAVVDDGGMAAANVSPLIAAIREAPQRPIRIITHTDETGRVFNCSFFEDEPAMRGFLDWYGVNALSPDGEYHHCLKSAAAETVPSPASLLFATGTKVLADTRFGEYQLGMAVRYTAWQPHSTEMFEEAAVEAAADEFEERIAACMQERGVTYFGRLLMTDAVGTVLTAVRYGSIDDARRGSALSRELMSTELSRWFRPAPPTVFGTALRVLEV